MYVSAYLRLEMKLTVFTYFSYVRYGRMYVYWYKNSAWCGAGGPEGIGRWRHGFMGSPEFWGPQRLAEVVLRHGYCTAHHFDFVRQENDRRKRYTSSTSSIDGVKNKNVELRTLISSMQETIGCSK
jgi:hypothetical protein